jgi:hypothetical protein
MTVQGRLLQLLCITHDNLELTAIAGITVSIEIES